MEGIKNGLISEKGLMEGLDGKVSKLKVNQQFSDTP